MSPLSGRRVVVTRAPHQAAELETLLRERGAVPILYPCIDFGPPADTSALDTALRETAAGAFDWLVLTSANTALALASRVAALGLRSPFRDMRVAAIGPATAQIAREHLGVQVERVPEDFIAEGLAAAMNDVNGARIFLPVSSLAEDTLAAALENRGARVTQAVAYETIPGSGGVDVPSLLANGEVDAITFTSPSTVANFLKRLDSENGRRDALTAVCAACIGPRTGATARNEFRVVVQASEHTLEGLIAALQTYFSVGYQEQLPHVD